MGNTRFYDIKSALSPDELRRSKVFDETKHSNVFVILENLKAVQRNSYFDLVDPVQLCMQYTAAYY